MTTARERCDHLLRAIERQDTEDVEAIAHQAVNLWLAGQASFRRLCSVLDQSSPYLQAAYDFMFETYCFVLLLINRASGNDMLSQTHHSLRLLRASLMFAMNQSQTGTARQT
jgi:hypothetical protein